MYVEVYRRSGLWAQLTGTVGWRWRLRTSDGVTLIDAQETFSDRGSCLALVALLISGLNARVVDSQVKRVLRRSGDNWFEGEEFNPAVL
ncbi:hypothetical protein [Stenotrophomonas muris]|uniref:hypothetical protein n=1 Tax=Stenotrophomonas muris TaxID=2963283 RepID=UPI002E76D7A7|nr:hypothetical protein [Stenotrophomonas muris]MBN5015900.1 hypothetical protein [Stenotrophomonas maltophilia]